MIRWRTCLLIWTFCVSSLVQADLRDDAFELGQKIDAARQQGPTIEDLQTLMEEVASLRDQAQAERINREKEVGENEVLLERLYRSPTWSGIGFTLAAMRYWRSWLLLDQYRLNSVQTDLEAARRGFQTTLALIVYPGLVRGSWLGLGHAEIAAGRVEEARIWFDRVAATDDPLGRQAREELNLLDALRARTKREVKTSITDAEADVIEREALALLERHGKSLDGASRAAERLRDLENTGSLSIERVLRLMHYRDEIIGHDIGPVGYLVSAENALAYEQFYTAVEKYRIFFKAIDHQRQQQFSDFRLQFASALIASGLIEEAQQNLSANIIAKVGDPQRLANLRLLAAFSAFANSGELKSRQTLLDLSAAMSTPAAHFTQSLLNADFNQAHNLLMEHSTDVWVTQLPAFELVYREFYAAALSKRRNLAPIGLSLYQQLPDDIAQASWALVAQMSMQGLMDQPVDTYLSRLEALSATVAIGYRDVLYATRIEFLHRRAPERLVAEITSLLPPLSDKQRDTLLHHVLKCGLKSWCKEVTVALIKLLQPGSQSALFALLQHIRLLAKEGDAMAAYRIAGELIVDYPDSGDALRVFADSAAAVGRTGDAEAAYARIAESLPIGSSEWRTARLKQLDLRIDAGASDAACELRRYAQGDADLIETINQRLAAGDIACNRLQAKMG